MTNGILLILTMVGLNILLSELKMRSPFLERWLDGLPIVILKDGKPIPLRMRKVRVDETDILAAARTHQGLERLDRIKYAIVEHNGDITIIPASRD